MKKSFFLLLLLTQMSSALELTCNKTTTDALDATYTINSTKGTNNVGYYRYKDSVAYNYSAQNISELYKKSRNDTALLTRAFVKDRRAIEYDAIDMRTEKQSTSWNQHKNLATPEQFNFTHVEVEQKNGCNIEHYSLHKDGVDVTMTWLKNYEVLVKLEVKKEAKISYVYMLDSLKLEDKKPAHMAMIENFDSTDYADIGDNESDPFFTKMITLGFVTHHEANIFDEKGNRLELAHAHH